MTDLDFLGPVNWSASLRPQHFIREQWAKDHGLPYFLSKEYAESIEAVCERMGVSDEHFKHNKANQLLISGSKKLGYPLSTIPQNTGGHAHACGYCGFGCVYSEKQSGPVTWLRDAAEAGARFMIETSVEKLLFAATPNAPMPTRSNLDQYTPTSKRKYCIGALVKNRQGQMALLRGREAVIVSAGTINSPAILMRSGLKNPRIGRNLRLHPVTPTTGYYDEPIEPWNGSIMTAVSGVQENWDGSHHGTKLEVVMAMPGAQAASFIGWKSSSEHKKALAQWRNTMTLIAIARDRGSKSYEVSPAVSTCSDPSLFRRTRHPGLGAATATRLRARPVRRKVSRPGRDRVRRDSPRQRREADPHEPDRRRRLVSPVLGIFRRRRSLTERRSCSIPAPGHKYLDDPRWKAWVASIEKAGMFPTRCALGSAHQMGSCQMGNKASTSVVDPRGRVWGTKGLYIADASVFPTASGVNPMITVRHGRPGARLRAMLTFCVSRRTCRTRIRLRASLTRTSAQSTPRPSRRSSNFSAIRIRVRPYHMSLDVYFLPFATLLPPFGSLFCVGALDVLKPKLS